MFTQNIKKNLLSASALTIGLALFAVQPASAKNFTAVSAAKVSPSQISAKALSVRPVSKVPAFLGKQRPSVDMKSVGLKALGRKAYVGKDTLKFDGGIVEFKAQNMTDAKKIVDSVIKIEDSAKAKSVTLRKNGTIILASTKPQSKSSTVAVESSIRASAGGPAEGNIPPAELTKGSFVFYLSNGLYDPLFDCNGDGVLNLLDVELFKAKLDMINNPTPPPPQVTLDDTEDFFSEFGQLNFGGSGASVTITGLPSIDGATTLPGTGAAALNQIAPAAGDEQTAEELASIESAAGTDGSQVTCWEDAATNAEAGQTVSYNFGGQFGEDLLEDATRCNANNTGINN